MTYLVNTNVGDTLTFNIVLPTMVNGKVSFKLKIHSYVFDYFLKNHHWAQA